MSSENNLPSSILFCLVLRVIYLQKRELAEKIKQRRKEREEIEEKEARERERKRIQMGQEIAERKRMYVYLQL